MGQENGCKKTLVATAHTLVLMAGRTATVERRSLSSGAGLKALFLAATGLSLLSASAIWFVAVHGWTLYYGDAEAHLDIARRIVDSTNPGYFQVGTVWLPLPHWLMVPLARNDALWHNGMAGAIPSGLCFVISGLFLFATVRHIFDSTPAAAAATALFGLNPNILYLQSIPMTEPLFFAALMALLYFTVVGSTVGAGLSALAGTLIRYDGWFLLPFVALYFWKRVGWRRALVFSLLAGAGPVYWLVHNYLLDNHPLEFVLGPYAPRAIQGGKPYPGLDNWRVAWLYVSTAARLCAGPALAWIGVAGLAVCLLKRVFWPLLLLALPGVFYIWSMHSSGGTPIYLPVLPPFSYYNSRYGVAAIPLLAFAGAILVAVAPKPAGLWVAVALVLAACLPWLLHPSPKNWVTWEDSRVNSEARLAWTREAAEYMEQHYRPGTGIVSAASDLRAIYRAAGIPLRETLTEDNGLLWLAYIRRPCLSLQQEWAITYEGDAVEQAFQNNRGCLQYHLEKIIAVKGAGVVKIYRR